MQVVFKFYSFISSLVHYTLSYLLWSPLKQSPLHCTGRESLKQEMHCLVRWLGNEDFKCTAMVRNSSGYARTICQILWAFWSFWALNHSYLAHQKYCDNRSSSKIIIFLCGCSDTSYSSPLWANVWTNAHLYHQHFGNCEKNYWFWWKNMVDFFFVLKIVSENEKACFNFVSPIGSQHL